MDGPKGKGEHLSRIMSGGKSVVATKSVKGEGSITVGKQDSEEKKRVRAIKRELEMVKLELADLEATVQSIEHSKVHKRHKSAQLGYAEAIVASFKKRHGESGGESGDESSDSENESEQE